MKKGALGQHLFEIVDDALPELRALEEVIVSRRPGKGAWSAKEILGHLIDSATNNHRRIVLAINSHHLVFGGYNQEEWVQAQFYQQRNWEHLVQLWYLYNTHMASVIALIPEEKLFEIPEAHNLERISFRAPESSEDASLAYLISDYIEHLQHHLAQILS